MLIAVVGTRYAGKSSVRDYLFTEGFTLLELTSSAPSNVPVSQRVSFSSAEDMLDFATRNWQTDFVTECLNSKVLLEPFLKRPFFLVLGIDAPILIRFQRKVRVEGESSLEDFVRENDELIYGKNSLSDIISGSPSQEVVRLTLNNSFDTKEALHTFLNVTDLTNQDRLRPRWDTYFMTLASLASLRSNCMKRRVGAILVRKNRVLATGYNGTPRGLKNCNEGGCSRCNGKAKSGEALDECLCLHAEENALLEAGRERIGDGAVLYCNTCPCLRCSVKIVQTGVKEVVYNLAYSMDVASANVFTEAGVTLRKHSPP